MRITSIELKNIGVFEQENITFQPCPTKGKAEIHIFTGTNGSGKSTLLKALTSAFEHAATTTDSSLVCSKDTNSLTKYMRYKGIESGATVCIDLDNEPYCINYHNCPHGASHIHLTSNDTDSLKVGRDALSKNSQIEHIIFDCVLFAYSGYRTINFSNGSTNNENVKNPLYESLEFVKNPNYSYNVEEWIKNSLRNRSYAQTEGWKEQQKNYNDTIEKVESVILELMNIPVQFRLDKKFKKPVVCYNDKEHDFEVLPDGLKSFISWLADLCMRLDDLNWVGDIPIFERNIILFLDEIEVHLHPEWQRKILPVVQKLFPNAQIFISTHSPFVVNSVDDAWVYNLELENGNAKVRTITLSQDGHSITNVLRTIFGVTEMFGFQVEKDLQAFYALRDKAQAEDLVAKDEKEMLRLAKILAVQSTELQTIIQFELRQINRQTQSNYAL